MHPIYNEERRKASAKAIQKAHGSEKGTMYVDAAGPIFGIAAVAVGDGELNVRNEAVIKRNSAEAEETAIPRTHRQLHQTEAHGTSSNVELIPKWQEY